jgi:hypothetical protein
MLWWARDRRRACEAAGVPMRFDLFDGADPVAFVVSANLARRHLNESQRAMVAARLANMPVGGNQHTRGSANLPTLPVTQPDAAEMLNVSTRSVRDAKAVQTRAVSELARKVEAGTISVSAAAEVAKLPEPKQAVVVAGGFGIRDTAGRCLGVSCFPVSQMTGKCVYRYLICRIYRKPNALAKLTMLRYQWVGAAGGTILREFARHLGYTMYITMHPVAGTGRRGARAAS